MASAKARDKGCNKQPLTGAAKATRRRTMEQEEDATTDHLWQRQPAAGNERERTAASNGHQKWAAAVDNRVNNCTTSVLSWKRARIT